MDSPFGDQLAQYAYFTTEVSDAIGGPAHNPNSPARYHATMHMLFVDESGTPYSNGGRSTHFVLGGVIIPDTQWSLLAKRLSNSLKQRQVTGEVKWRYFSPSNGSSANALAHLNPTERNALRTELLTHLTAIKSVRLIAVVVDLKAMDKMRADQDAIYHGAYKPLTERFQYFLQDISRTSGTATQGIIVADNRGPRDDKRLRETHDWLLSSNGVHVSRYDNLIEGLFIAPSDKSVGIQYADLVAGSVYRSFAHNDDSCFNVIQSSFRRNPTTGNIRGYGIVHVPNR